jgi:hypothetical protein
MYVFDFWAGHKVAHYQMTLASMVRGGGLRNWWQPLFLIIATLSGLANAKAGGIVSLSCLHRAKRLLCHRTHDRCCAVVW